jgi:serine/threonine protein kinase
VSKIQHESIVPVYDAGIVDERCYVVFKFIEGTNLTRYIEDELPPLPFTTNR